MKLAATLVVMGFTLAGPAAAQPAPPLLHEPLAVAEGYSTTMIVITLPPGAPGVTSTENTPGHRHPGATYAYVLEGAVRSRVGATPERLYSAGEAWSEAPGDAHHIINASPTAPARVLVVFIAPAGAALTEPLPR